IVSEGWRIFRADPDLTSAALEREQERERGRLRGLFGRGGNEPAESDRASASMRAECEADLRALAALDHRDRLRRLVEDANRGNVSLYTIYAPALVGAEPGSTPASAAEPVQDAANV